MLSMSWWLSFVGFSLHFFNQSSYLVWDIQEIEARNVVKCNFLLSSCMSAFLLLHRLNVSFMLWNHVIGPTLQTHYKIPSTKFLPCRVLWTGSGGVWWLDNDRGKSLVHVQLRESLKLEERAFIITKWSREEKVKILRKSRDSFGPQPLIQSLLLKHLLLWWWFLLWSFMMLCFFI